MTNKEKLDLWRQTNRYYKPIHVRVWAAIQTANVVDGVFVYQGRYNINLMNKLNYERTKQGTNLCYL